MKKKVFDKFHSLKVDGLTKRWLLNIILVVVIVLAVTFTVACVTIKNYYYNSVENILKSGASTNAVNYFSNNLDSGTSLESSAVKFIDNYAYKEKPPFGLSIITAGCLPLQTDFWSAIPKWRIMTPQKAPIPARVNMSAKFMTAEIR